MGLSESDIIKYCAEFFEKEKEKRLAQLYKWNKCECIDSLNQA